MLETIGGVINVILGLGLGEDKINPGQILARALIVYIVTVALVQMGSRRFLGRTSVFDAIIAIMLGSIMSRGITGSAPMLQTFYAGAALIALHWLFATLSYHTSIFGPLLKGQPIQLIKDGKILNEQMRKANFSENDLIEVLRLEVRHEDPSEIKSAYLERNGKVSVIPYPRRPCILKTSVQDGTQSLKIELD
jgi:uncharacterized membrane protein YcaP (DUF421 family)